MWRETVNKRNHYKYFLLISRGAAYVDVQQKQLFLRFVILAGDEVTCFILEESVVPTADNIW